VYHLGATIVQNVQFITIQMFHLVTLIAGLKEEIEALNYQKGTS
jgi:hypothetical protein